MQRLFTPKDVARLVGISYRQIQYWDSSGFIAPSVRRRGRFRYYTFGDLILLEMARRLREEGASIQRLRKVVRTLAQLVSQGSRELENLTFLVDRDQVLVFTGELYMDEGSARSLFRFRTAELSERVARMLPEEEVGAAEEAAV